MNGQAILLLALTACTGNAVPRASDPADVVDPTGAGGITLAANNVPI